ncbi:MAG: tRNA uridine-5-carboxymethylaminomethyl(34) synthesis GTPase MnmE [Bacteroidota bacterium]
MTNYLRSDLNDTICALATPEGIGAIGVIRISGANAITLVNEVFEGKNLSKQATHTAHFGRIVDKSNTEKPHIIDEVLATLFVAPKSYTGENTVEISCHGSAYIQQQILQTLIKKGARSAKPGEFTMRAFLNKKLDLTQAEAVADLIASNSEASHQTAMSQMRGGFSSQIIDLRERLVNFASLIELELDFGEEDVEFASRPQLKELVENILHLVQSLLQSFKYGNAIKNGIPTVIVGKPNAGKSTLLNALVNEERAIVSDIAGTTRDTIEETFVIDGILFRLIDTAGIRKHTNDAIETIGIERTFESINKAGIVIYLFDSSTTTCEELQAELAALASNHAVIIPVANKIDLLSESNKEAILNTFTATGTQAKPIFVSTLQKNNLAALNQKLIEIVRGDEVKNDVIITNMRHYEALLNTATALQDVLTGMDMQQTGDLLAFDIRKAIFHLGEIVGDITTDDLLENIFSKFCIGK